MQLKAPPEIDPVPLLIVLLFVVIVVQLKAPPEIDPVPVLIVLLFVLIVFVVRGLLIDIVWVLAEFPIFIECVPVEIVPILIAPVLAALFPIFKTPLVWFEPISKTIPIPLELKRDDIIELPLIDAVPLLIVLLFVLIVVQLNAPLVIDLLLLCYCYVI